MPVILEFHGLKFKINVNDHNPPHVHIEGKGCSARVKLGVIEVLSNDGFSLAGMRTILLVIADNQEYLMEAWNEYRQE